MPGIFDLLIRNGILNSVFNGQPTNPRAQGLSNQQTMADILAGKVPVPKRSNDPALMVTNTPPAITQKRSDDVVAMMGPQDSPSPFTSADYTGSPVIAAMQNQGALTAPRTPTQDVVNDMDASSRPMNVQVNPASTGIFGSNFDLGNALKTAGRGLMIAGSVDPARAAAAFSEDMQNERDANKVKVTPIQGGAFSLITKPGGQTEIVRNDEVAQFIEKTSGDKLLRDILLANVKGDIATKGAASKEQIKTAGDSTQTALAVTELNDIANALEKTDTATGPAVGLLPKMVRDIVTPGGADLQDRAERIIQASLRATLGAQFTEKEGTRFLERAYNPRLDEATNAARLRQVAKELESIQADKEGALEYMKRKGTLDGFVPRGAGTGTVPAAPAPAPASSGGMTVPGLSPNASKYFQ
jgi:hypothetical protein